MRKLFGTDGIRGVANTDPMTVDIALKTGQAVAYLLRRKKGHTPRIIIGKDTRLSGYMLESALAAGITSMGANVILVGPMPTPGIAFITNNMDADAGIVISASHNPFEDNGIKIFSKEGFKLTDDEEAEIERLIFSDELPSLVADPRDIGKEVRAEDALGRYIVFLRKSFPKELTLEGMKIVLDCANGATYKVAPTLFREMRAEVVNLNVVPDGTNINRDSGSLHPEILARKVKENNADIGLAFDGDGDRLIAVDEQGKIVSGDTVIAICARKMKEEGKLQNNLVVSTVMSNLGFYIALKEMGMNSEQTTVGDRYVLEAMLAKGGLIGGEDSGHIIFLEHHTTGDGILTALQLMAVIKKDNKPLSELARVMKVFPQLLLNVTVKEKPPLESVPEIMQAVKEAEAELGDKGRVLVRYSGTQPMCRVMVEAATKEQTEEITKRIVTVVKEKLA